MVAYTTRTTCRVCGSGNLTPLFSLGSQFVSDFVKVQPDDSEKCPIDLELCGGCSLVQMKHTAPQELLYSRKYWYRSGVTLTMRQALLDVVNDALDYVDWLPGDIALDIGSNDGTLLRHYPLTMITVGIEPASNFTEEGADGITHFINDFWDYEEYAGVMWDNHIKESKAKIITACGMFYDLEDPHQFIWDVRKVLHKDGLFIAQLMCLKNMLSTKDIGNMAHEHLEFYSLASLNYLFNKHDLELIDIETNDINGESYRLYVRPKGGSIQPRKGSYDRLLDAHLAEKGMDEPGYYTDFFAEMEANKSMVREFVELMSTLNRKIWVYGASTKGNVILQYYGLTNKLIRGAAERSPSKYGLRTVGTDIPIVSEELARADYPDFFLVLPYAFLDEFIERESTEEWRKCGGKFLVPFPTMRVV